MTEPVPHSAPDDVPARHDRLAAAMLTPLIDHGLREAVKWVMEPELLAMEAEVEKRVRAQVAAAYRAAAEQAQNDSGEGLEPLAEALARDCRVDDVAPAVFDDARNIAFVAYRHLADRLEGDQP